MLFVQKNMVGEQLRVHAQGIVLAWHFVAKAQCTQSPRAHMIKSHLNFSQTPMYFLGRVSEMIQVDM